MLYARVNKETNEVLEFPVSEQQLRDNLVNTTLPTKIIPMALEGTQYVMVPPLASEDIALKATATHRLAPTSCEPGTETNVWVRSYELVEVPTKDIEARVNRRWVLVRKKRDELLAELDWKVLRNQREQRLGLTPTDDIAVLDARMQELADITDGVTDPFTIDTDNM